MRKLAIGLALASTALATPSMARDGQWYVGVDGGAMIVEDLKADVGPVPLEASLDTDTGYDFGAVVGYDFGGFRLEAETSYRNADVTGTSSSAALMPSGAGTALQSAGSYDTAGGANALSFMLNGVLDFGEDDGLQGFVGGGVGVARVDVKNIFAAPAWLDDSDTGFAWQAIAGIRAPLSDSWDVGLKYRFFNAPGVDLVDRLGRDVSTRFRSHSLMGSLVYNFGGEPEPEPVAPPPPPPVVAPPPPPPPPPPQQKAPPPEFVPPVDIPVSATAGANAIAAVSNTPAPPPPPPVANVRTPAVINAAQNCQKPEYPSASRRNEEEGTVQLRFLIGTNGQVIESQVEKSSGFARLDEAARSALSKCQFKPGTLNGAPEQSWASMKYTWRLE